VSAPEPPTPAIGQSITFLLVEDLERSARFYSGDLGLAEVLDQGSCRIYRVAADAYLGICERPGRTSSDGVIVTIVTPDVEGWHRRLTARGVPAEQPPRANAEYRIHHALYRDPDGHLVEIQRFDDGWPPPGT
jgi:catechol 2,3-dioxygenase-like lactoylglutathione lyase family enzyme